MATLSVGGGGDSWSGYPPSLAPAPHVVQAGYVAVSAAATSLVARSR
jgi:hypothetical protein